MGESHEAFFTVDIEVGTPGQKLPVLLDTGSSDVSVLLYSPTPPPPLSFPQGQPRSAAHRKKED